jgi:hypothetical protein
MAKAKANLDVRTATTFADIFNDNSATFYEVFLKPTKGNTVKRYLTRGTISPYGERRCVCQCYSKAGQPVFSWYNGIKSFAVNKDAEKGLEITSAKVQCDYHLYTAYVSREDAFHAAMHGLKLQKLKINKQIIKLQNDLYSEE